MTQKEASKIIGRFDQEIKNRMSYIIEALNENGETILEFNAFKMSPTEVSNNIEEIIPVGTPAKEVASNTDRYKKLQVRFPTMARFKDIGGTITKYRITAGMIGE